MRLLSLLSLALPFVITAIASAQENANDAARFPFVMPWDDASKTVVSVADLNPAPLNDTHRIVARDGHFYDLNGRRVRFLGVNFSFNANFPDKADAEKIAARLHKFGVNCVRMHHMDSAKAPRGIFDANVKDWQHLDAEQLDRMDYLVSQFKKYGIYVDLNLHVGRALGEADGFTPIPAELRAFRQGKVLAYFEPRMIEIQKNYARDLLTRRNPYTGTTYAEDPTIALVEINNEDTLLGAGWGDTLRTMPEPYRGQLRAMWNEWLRAKYPSTPKLLSAWNAKAQPLGDNLLSNADLAMGLEGWSLEHSAPGLLTLAVEDAGNRLAEMPQRALRVNIPAQEATARVRWVHRLKLDLKDGQTYTLRFWAKADKPRDVVVDAKIQQEPWTNIGLNQTVPLTTDWKLYTVRFTAQRTVPSNNRVSFKTGNEAGEIWLSGVTLQPGSAIEFDAGETLEKSSIEMPPITSTPQGEDFVAFLMNVEQRYVEAMTSHIRNTLGSKSLITCSQASYGGLGGMWRESKMDFVDMHSYWQHPIFPNRPWDPVDWRIPNVSLVKATDGGTLSRLAMHRLAGKPFTVSEYNHPAPNDFAAEGLPMLAAYAAAQDWDGIFLFAYGHSREAMKIDRIGGFFDIASDPAKMVFLPAAARIFLTGNVAPAPPLTLVVPQDKVAELVAGQGRAMNNLWFGAGAASQNLLAHRSAVRFADGPLRVQIAGHSKAKAPFLWDAEKDFVRYAQNDSAAIIGFTSGQNVSAGDFSLQIAQPDFAVTTLTSLDGKPLRESSSLLLTTMSRTENSDMGWNEKRDSVGRQWGTGPVQVVGLSGEVSIITNAKTATVHALDATGARGEIVPAKLENGKLTFRLDPQRKAVWYEIAATR